jgi:hypothetical protein
VSLNGCFSSTYDNYVIQLTQTSVTADGETSFRMRASGSDNSSSVYQWAGVYNRWDSATLSANYASSLQTRYPIIGFTANTYDDGVAHMEIFSPYLSQKTTGFNKIFSHDGTQYVVYNGFNIDVTTSFDGFTVYRADTITGTVSVYGYNN